VRSFLIATLIAVLEIPARAGGPSAEDLYAQGQAAYDRGEYLTAIEKWQESYRLSGEPGLLFNLAQARRLASDCPEALATYRRFLAADPTSDQHQIAVDLAKELEGQCPAPKPVRPAPRVPQVPKTEPELKTEPAPEIKQPTPTPPAKRHSGHSLRVAGIAAGGTGIVALATGLYFGHHAQTIGDQVTSACRSGCDWTAWKAADAEGRRDATIGRVLDVAGTAGIVGGAILYYVGVREGVSITITPMTREGGTTVTWSGSW
jgi:tetratricopeptide (TPR) repeat protein